MRPSIIFSTMPLGEATLVHVQVIDLDRPHGSPPVVECQWESDIWQPKNDDHVIAWLLLMLSYSGKHVARTLDLQTQASILLAEKTNERRAPLI
jgi:hypothetical protein